MRCPSCNHKLAVSSLVLREFTCKHCDGIVSVNPALSISAALMGLAISGLFSTSFKLEASVLLVLSLVGLAVLVPRNLSYSEKDKT